MLCFALLPVMHIVEFFNQERDTSMQASPVFQARCKAGKLVVDDAIVQVIAPFHKLVWSAQKRDIAWLLPAFGWFMSKIHVYTADGPYLIETLSTKNAKALVSLFGPLPGLLVASELVRIKAEIEQCRLALQAVNLQMSSTRARYQQGHMHGGGKLGSFVRSVEQSGKNSQLAARQGTKEQLSWEKLRLEQQLAQLKALAAQGVMHVKPDGSWL